MLTGAAVGSRLTVQFRGRSVSGLWTTCGQIGETVTPPAGGSQSRRVATVVAASPVVRAAIIPYPAAKAYLARHPLVS